MNRFESKTVLVTGGSSGIGLAAALAFQTEGARVFLTGRDQQALDSVTHGRSDTLEAIRNDASRLADAHALAEELSARGAKLDAVFLNAGVARFAPLDQVEPGLWDEIFDTNVKGPYFQVQALVPLMNPGASIVINGSINARIGMPNTSVYAASKAAVISLARTLSAELIPKGIRVNVLSPGPVTTPIYRKLGLDDSALKETSASIQTQIPLGRFGTAEEIAATVLHLAASESAYIVGTEIIADGGMSQL
jgi:NAD(P)-dependent dehydrogenase (short-subunit alcohol dehydrogenase family)